MRLRRFVLAVPLLVVGSGCIKQALINGQIEGTREASVAFDGFGDYEAARAAAGNALVQFEGMHTLAPDNVDALFLLTKAYTGYGFAFVEDDMEIAEDALDREAAEHHRQRARFIYRTAINYGLELLATHAEGFDEAKKDAKSLDGWLKENFTDPEVAGDLFWTGYAWVSFTNVSKDDAVAVANLWMGVALVKRSVELDPGYNAHSGQIILGGYHARTANAELDQAKALFETVLSATDRKFLLAQTLYATTWACARADAESYDKLLREVVAAEDPDPAQRLSNIVAQRRARRWLGEQRMFNACSMDPLPPPDASLTLGGPTLARR